MEIALLGHMGRDHALSDRLVAAGHRLHVAGPWANAGLVENAHRSGGRFYPMESITDAAAAADFVTATKADMFVTNSDDALAAGVVDAVRAKFFEEYRQDLLIPCPDKAAARIEWDKFALREIVAEFAPEFNPENSMVTHPSAVDDAIEFFREKGMEVAIKPRNLTGGKGVKVMGKNLADYEAARTYAHGVLDSSTQTGIEIQEKLEGHEFTLQLLTDGKTLIRPPATYDYSYREDGDKGPQTGGMGTIAMSPGEQLSFMTHRDYEDSIVFSERLLDALQKRGIDYKGVLYVNFFKTPRGLKLVEVNARGGDPELINIVDTSEESVDWGDVLARMATGDLEPDSVRYRQLASTMIYLVPPEHGYSQGAPVDFRMDMARVKASDCLVRFAAAEHVQGDSYRSVGSSRTVGLCALAETPWDAREKIENALRTGFEYPLPFAYRKDIGDKAYLQSMGQTAV